MKVENTQTNRLTQTQAENAAAVEKTQRMQEQETRSGALTGKDQASFSERARLLAKARTALEETPDTRTDLVKNIKDKVENGNYEVPIQDLVKSLVTRLRTD
jgi:flagellar biosynthesis anti-sigma factor FlgM